MLKTVRKAFQIEDIRKRLFYTVFNADRCKIWFSAPDSGS